MISPAQVPYTGIPPPTRVRSGSSIPKSTASLDMVVDSPPGITSPSTASSSPGRRTVLASAPADVSAARCSRTSPWSARTPITGAVMGAYQPRFA